MKRIALIGCGIWGTKILANLIKLGCEVEVFDQAAEVPDGVRQMGIQVFSKGLPSTADYDGFIVATPSTTHRTVVEQLANLQVPIFLEKPLTTNLEDAKSICNLGYGDIYLMHIWLYHPGIIALADLARSGELGSVKGVRTTRANWTSPRKDTDSVWNLAPHDITIAKAILGEIPEPRAAVLENHKGMARGMYAVMGDDPYCVLEVSNRFQDKRREVRIHCENGVAVLKDEKSTSIEIIYGDAESDLANCKIENRPFDRTEPLLLEIKEFIDYLSNGDKPRSSLEDGLEVIETIDKLIKLASKPTAVR